MKYKTPFNKPHITSDEYAYLKQAHKLGQLSGDGYFTRLCHEWLEKKFAVKKALLTHSCTGAMEMMALLINIKPGDEVIMPSYTFVSTANAFVLRGAVPVFVDIRKDTLNIDENLIENAITKKTRAIIVVHYAGVGCEMDAIKRIARKHHLFLFEDAAQGFMAKYKGQHLGTIGEMSAYSFHETKNVISGEGGALLINKKSFMNRAEIIREKGTNRSKFFRGQVDKYSWVDIGSSYLPSEIIAAFLYAQLEHAQEITKRRLSLWNRYNEAFAELEQKGIVRRPFVPKECVHNGHLYYLLLKDLKTRTELIQYLRDNKILSVAHYVPLHSSKAGKKYSRFVGNMSVTNMVTDTLVRLPLFYDISNAEIEKIISLVHKFFKKKV